MECKFPSKPNCTFVHGLKFVPGHPAVVDGDDADRRLGSGDVVEREDVAGSAVRARELEVAARVGQEDEALGVKYTFYR